MSSYYNLTTQARTAFGLDSKSKLPRGGAKARMVGFWCVWIEPLKEYEPYSGGFRYKGRRMTHRFLAKCPCGQIVSVGRTHQHKCKAQPK